MSEHDNQSRMAERAKFQQRIQELEAERETWVDSIAAANRAQKAYRDEKARAERAELHTKSLEQALRNEMEIRKKETDINLKLEARVAELEWFIGKMHKTLHANVSAEHPCPLDGFYWGRLDEAREREHEHGPECEALYANEPEHFASEREEKEQ